MLKPLHTNPLVDQALRSRRWPSPRRTLVLLIVAFIGSMAGRGWLIDQLPAGARAVLLLLLWLLPLVTMAVAATSTARRLHTESFQLVKQSSLTDRQITWGLGLGTLYTLRVMLVPAFGLLPALVDDRPLGSASTMLCLAGLHLAGSMLGTLPVLRWGRQRLGLVLVITGCVLVFSLLPIINMLLLPMLTPGCPSTVLHPGLFRLSAVLLRWGLLGPLPVVVVTVLPFLLGWVAAWIPWRGREEGRQPQLEALGIALAVMLASSMWVTRSKQSGFGERGALVALYRATGGEDWFLQEGWLSTQPMCTWYGVVCSCGRVVDLYLTGNNLRGRLPPEISQLTSLQYLYLKNNQLTELPPEIGQIVGLRLLDMNSNRLTELPPEIGRLANLEWSDLSYNQLSELPPEIGQLAGLRWLNLSHNQLSELPQEICQRPTLSIEPDNLCD